MWDAYIDTKKKWRNERFSHLHASLESERQSIRTVRIPISVYNEFRPHRGVYKGLQRRLEKKEKKKKKREEEVDLLQLKSIFILKFFI